MRSLLLAPLALLLSACAAPPPAAPAAPAAPGASAGSAAKPERAGPPPASIARGLAELWSRHDHDRVDTQQLDGRSAEDHPDAGAEPSEPAESSPPPPPAPVVDDDALRAVLATLTPTTGDSLLLLGVHLEDVATYAPLYSGDSYPVDERPGYRTIVVRIDEQGARVEADLPYLMVPQATGFSFFGEAEVAIDEGFDPAHTNGIGELMPLSFAASRLVSAANPTALAARIAAEKRRLIAGKEWGKTDMESLIAITPRARCSQFLDSEVTGGALGFFASTWMHMSAVADPLPRTRLTDAELREFGERLAAGGDMDVERLPDGRIDLDKPVELWWRTLSWRKDVAMCIARHRGQTQITGATTIPGNSARSFTVAYALGPAGTDLAPGNAPPLDYDALASAIADLGDAFVSPTQNALVAVAAGRLLVFTAGGEERLSTAIGLVRPVMAEWATGASVERWLKAAAR